MNRRILLVSYVYPPVSSPGAIRTLKMQKFLPRYGVETEVLTCKNAYSIRIDDKSERQNNHNINSVSEWIPKKNIATKVGGSRKKSTLLGQIKKISKIFLIPDKDITWYYNASRYGRSIVTSNQINVVWSTSPSITNHLVANYISRKCNIPHIIDFRDLWTLEPTYKQKTSIIRRYIDKIIEKKLIGHASMITVVSPLMKEDLLKHYPQINKHKIKTIFNGFDADDYSNLDLPEKQKYRLLYAGSLYGNERNPNTVLRAIKELSDEQKISPDIFEFVFVGEENDYLEKQINKLNIQEYIYFSGQKTFLESLSWIKSADRLLVITRKDKASFGELTSKIFDYMGSKNKITTLTNKQAILSKITNEIGGDVVEFENINHMKKLIVEDISNNKHQTLNKNIDKYTREKAAIKLASEISNLPINN